MKQYETSYPHTAIVLIEPDHRDAELYLANTFSYRQRRELAEHAYQQTRQLLRSQHSVLNAKLQQHGLSLDLAVLSDPARRLLPTDAPARPATVRGLPRKRGTTTRLGHALDMLQTQVDGLQDALDHGNLVPRRGTAQPHAKAVA